MDKFIQHTMLFEPTCRKCNVVIIGCKIELDTYKFGSIYGPNRRARILPELEEKLGGIECDHIILGGDLNFVMSYQKDCYGYLRENNVNARNRFIELCNKHSLIDIWRYINPNINQYT